MKKMRVRIGSILLAALILLPMLPVLVSADNVGASEESPLTSAEPVIIYTAEQLYNQLNQNKDGIFRLGNDIDLSEFNEGIWKPIGTKDDPFSGSLDGDGFTIKNMCLNEGSGRENGTLASWTWVGLFGYTENSDIKNLNVEIKECKAQGASYVELGGISGRDSGSTIKNIIVYGNTLEADPGTGDWKYHGGHVGGIVGAATETTIIHNAHNYCDLKIDNDLYDVYVGGISGEEGQVSLSSNHGNISIDGWLGGGYAGGIIGRNGQVSESYNTGDISLYASVSYSHQYTGGIIGYGNIWGPITNCYNSGDITSVIGRGDVQDTHASGIINDVQNGTITSCYNVGTITAFHKGTGKYYISSNADAQLPADMMKQENFIGFDFETVWVMPTEGSYLYPKLRNNWADEDLTEKPYDPNSFDQYIYRARKLQDMAQPYVKAIEETLAETTPCTEMVRALQQSGFDEAAKVWQTFSLISDSVDDVTALYDFAAAPQDMYAAIILNALQASVEYDLIASEYEKYIKSSNDFISTISQDMQAKYEIDLSSPEIFSQLTDEQKKDLSELSQKYFQNKHPIWNDLGEFFHQITTGVEMVGNIENFYERIVACITVFQADKYIQQVLERAYLDSQSMDNPYLEQALLDCVEIVNSSSQDLINKIVSEEMTIIGVDAAKYLIKEVLWDQVTSALYLSHPAVAVFQAAYQSGKYVSNLLFSTDDTIEQYMYMLATTDIEQLINETYSALRSDFLSTQDTQTAGVYLSALDLMFNIRKEDCKQAYDFIDLLDQSLINVIAHLFEQDNFADTKNYLSTRETKYKTEHESALTNWISYLEEDYPDSGLYEHYKNLLEESTNSQEGKEFVAACPVNVYVFDESEQMIASIVDDKVTVSGNLTAGIIGDKKVIRFYGDQNYSIQYVGNDIGEMDVTVTEISPSGQPVRNVQFYKVPLQDALSYDIDVPKENLLPEEYILFNTKEEQGIGSDYDSLQENEQYDVSVQSGSLLKNGEIFLATKAEAGEQLELHAYVPENYEFVRWESSNGENIFADLYSASTTCIMPAEDIVIRAVIRTVASTEITSVESITIDKKLVTLHSIGESEQLKVSVSPDDATNKTIIWHSSDSNVVSVNNGLVTAHKMGRVTITATTVDGGLTASCIVVVENQEETGAGGNHSGTSSNEINSISLLYAENGSITLDVTSAYEGEIVHITTTPNEGYELGTLTVTDRNGKTVTLNEQTNGSFTFVMPASDVTIRATFVEAEPAEPALPFTDVDSGDWFYAAVAYAYQNGLMAGVSDTAFRPEGATSRGMIVAILWRLEGAPEAGGSGFADVASQMYYAPAVAWAEENGIVTGISESEFQPDRAITREELAAILYRYAAYKGHDVTARADLSPFADAGAVSPYAVEALQWATAEELIQGVTPTALAPQGGATRAQAATLLMRLGEHYPA